MNGGKKVDGDELIDFLMYSLEKNFSKGQSLHPMRQRVTEIGKCIIKYTFLFYTLRDSPEPGAEYSCGEKLTVIRTNPPARLMSVLLTNNVIFRRTLHDALKTDCPLHYNIFEAYKESEKIDTQKFVKDLMNLVNTA